MVVEKEKERRKYKTRRNKNYKEFVPVRGNLNDFIIVNSTIVRRGEKNIYEQIRIQVIDIAMIIISHKQRKVKKKVKEEKNRRKE